MAELYEVWAGQGQGGSAVADFDTLEEALGFVRDNHGMASFAILYPDGVTWHDWSQKVEFAESPLVHDEDQDTVVAWCNQTFPGDTSVETRFANLLEEVIELGMALGVHPVKYFDIVRKVVARSRDTFGDSSIVPEEIGDVDLTLKYLAGYVGEDTQKCLNAKMAKNRSRPIEYYREKEARKRALGLY